MFEFLIFCCKVKKIDVFINISINLMQVALNYARLSANET